MVIIVAETIEQARKEAEHRSGQSLDFNVWCAATISDLMEVTIQPTDEVVFVGNVREEVRSYVEHRRRRL